MRSMPRGYEEALANAKQAFAFSVRQNKVATTRATYVHCPVCPPGSDRDCTLVGLGTYQCRTCGAIFSQSGLY
jgi:ribosomal protein L37AE/L43A